MSVTLAGETEARAALAADARRQSLGCAEIGSPIYERLCLAMADDTEAKGPCWDLLRNHAHVPFGHALHLRLLGGVHRIALRGDAPGLASHYPSCGGTSPFTDGPDGMRADDAGVRDLWTQFLRVLADHAAEATASLDVHVQTNEVVRSSALVEAFGAVQRATGRPLALREIGCSGALNLQLPWYRYVDGDRLGGDPHGRVVIANRWRGAVRPAFTPLDVVDRAGCDPNPLDATTEAGRLALLGFLWPDQIDRIERTSAAIDLARARPPRVVRSTGSAWLEQELPARPAGATTVVFHSIVWQYLDDAEKARITGAMRAEGARATADRPLAWVRFESAASEDHAETRVRIWDGSSERGHAFLLARHGFHGQWVELEPRVV